MIEKNQKMTTNQQRTTHDVTDLTNDDWRLRSVSRRVPVFPDILGFYSALKSIQMCWEVLIGGLGSII